MNRIVRHHVPASQLPDELRGDFASDAIVTVTVEEEQPLPLAETPRAMLEKLRARPGKGVTSDEAVARIRALRDEWPD